MKYITFSLVFLTIFLSACSQPTVVFKEVKVPVKCDVPSRHRPVMNNKDSVTYLREVLIYTEGIESDLKFCKENNIVKE